MCGITGIFNFKGFPHASDVKRMLETIHHRGPDGSGISCFNTVDKTCWSQPVGHVDALPDKDRFDLILGHTRLSIIDLSSAGHQPMRTSDGRLWITYNGEVYNYRELRTELKNSGYIFHSHTDTEVVLYTYKEYGKNCLEHLRGIFAFCIYDVNKNLLFMARDRPGLKPLKYYWDGKQFAFASEIKALLQLRHVMRETDPAAIDQYLAYRYIQAPLTSIKNIYKLPAGCSMTLSLDNPGNGPDIERYWQPQFEPKIDISLKEAKEKIVTLLEESIRLRLISDVPIGIFLSGGIDSSSIIAILRKKFNGELRTFSVGFKDEQFDERPFARMVVEQYNTIHTELLVEFSPEHDLRHIVWHFDEPFGDPSAIPSFYLAKATAPYVKVILNGDGGDEALAGYKRYRIHSRNRFLDYLPDKIYCMANRILAWLPASADKKHGCGKVGRLIESISGDMVDTYPLRFSGFSMKIRQALYRENRLWEPAKNGWPDEILSVLEQTGAYLATDRLMSLDQLTYLPEDILVKSDLAGMAHSIEARSPFLDHVFLDWVNRLPLSWKIDKFSKRLLLEAMADALPDGILRRKKAGFNPPLARWTKTALKSDLERYLLSENSPLKIFDRPLMKKMFDIHQSGKTNLSEPLWLLLVLAVWLEENDIQMAC